MKVHKLDIDDFSEIDYELIAINTTTEDYLLAFLINKELKLALKRNKTDILSSGNTEIGFSRYGFEDHSRDLFWTLVQNQKWTDSQTNNSWLFEQTQQKTYLLPEFKHVDYFLKIECWEFRQESTTDLLNKLKKIEKISAVFPIDIQKIKSKNNLIF